MGRWQLEFQFSGDIIGGGHAGLIFAGARGNHLGNIDGLAQQGRHFPCAFRRVFCGYNLWYENGI